MKKLLLLALMIVGISASAQWVETGVELLDVKWENQVKRKTNTLEKQVGMIIPRYSDEILSDDFTWRFDNDGTKWGYLRGEWKNNCSRAIIALYDKDENFITKKVLYLDFGTFETLLESNLGVRASYAKIKCDN